MKTSPTLAEKKAELIIHPFLYIPPEIHIPFPKEKSTSGPSAGTSTIALCFSNTRVKMNSSTHPNERFCLEKTQQGYQIVKQGKLFIDQVSLLHISFHAPHQVFLNLDNRCIHSCLFCTAAQTSYAIGNKYNEEKIISFLTKALQKPDITSIALTSGIYPDNQSIIHKIANISKQIKQQYPPIPIGAEPCINNKDELLQLSNAGIDEIKINLQTPDPHIFAQICPDFSYPSIQDMLTQAVDIFGKGKVTTNLIIGLGETPESVQNSIQELTTMGVIPVLRCIKINEHNKQTIHQQLGIFEPQITVNQLVSYTQMLKSYLIKNDLDIKNIKTMCYPCGCCDLIPFRDV